LSISNLWLRRFHPAPDAPVRLICLPHAGGSASSFFALSRLLSPAIEVLAVQYPGRQDRIRERLIGSVAELASGLLDVIIERDPRPIALLGHSMGASVAFELGLRMQDHDVQPVALFPSGRRAPSLRRDDQNHLLSDAELLAKVARLGGTAAQLLDDEYIRRAVLPVIRNDFRAAATYRGGDAVLDGPIFAMAGRTDPEVALEEVRCWARHSRRAFSLREFDGAHFFLFESTTEVAAHVSSALGSVNIQL
jgi:pyochelin biosynthetic protein PchC